MKKQNRSIASALVLSAPLILSLLGARPLRAGTIYNNLGPGNTWIINREYDTNLDYMASRLVTTSAGNLGDLLIPLFSLNNPATMALYTDSGGRPNTLLESWTVNLPGFPGILTTLTSVQNPFLAADTQYWFVITITDAQKDNLAWYENNQGIKGGVWAGNSLSGLIEFEGDSPMPAIQLNSTTTPEPATVLLIATSLLLWGIWRVKSRRGEDQSA